MFHRYVLAYSGKSVDFDRASYLMDQKLLNESRRERIKEMNSPHNRRDEIKYSLQWVWDNYCQRHLEKYGESFAPNVNPSWDS
jgi:hypothetical protein